MKTQEKPRIDLENRTKLEGVIPLQTPFVIFIDPADCCNFKCKFCPTGDRALMKKVGRPFSVMDFDLYKKIIDDITEFKNPIKVLRLYKDGEPLMNPRFADMIKYAKDKSCAGKIDTTTNASFLTPEKSLEIIEAGLDRMNISIEGVNSEQYQSFSRSNLDFNKLVENIRFFYKNKKQCEVLIKTNGDVLSEQDKKDFYSIFSDICDKIYIEHIMSCWPSFELDGVDVNEEVGIYGQKIKEVMVCPYVFYSISINSDGTASLCFLDWERKLIIGDAKKESLVDIWNGANMKNYQQAFLSGNRKEVPICNECGQMTHGSPDNIDAFANEILEKLEGSI